MVCAVNHAPQSLEMCDRDEISVFSEPYTLMTGCKYVSDMSHSFCYGTLPPRGDWTTHFIIDHPKIIFAD